MGDGEQTGPFRGCAYGRATSRTWQLLKRLKDLRTVPWRIRYSPIGASSKQQDPQKHFAIEVRGEATGGIGLELGSDIERRSAEMGYWLGEDLWGRGITTVAVRAVTEYGFEALHLTRIFAVPFASTSASIRVLEKCGYVHEGTMRRSAIKEGVVIDQELYALTDEDFARTSPVT
jgi:RimJ/RimL family protein N-acetyltransferase